MVNTLLAILAWWLSLELIGWAAWPLTASFFRGLGSRGAAWCKHLGLLLTGYLLWLLVSFHVLENTRVVILLVIVGVAALSLVASRRERLSELWRAQRRQLLAGELLFLGAFLAYLAFRAFDPAINHTEQPMDFGFLNAIVHSRTFPPNDMWFSGYAISYYYFGYLLMAVLTKLSGVPGGIAYNLALGTVFALTVTGAYGLVSDLSARRRRPWVWGLVGSLFVAIAGNLEGILELAHANGIGSAAFWHWVNIPALTQAPLNPGWLPGLDWWWWRATRLIQDVNVMGKMPEVITEFPSFSFILGDLHPHVMALPFGLLALAAAWNLLRLAPDWPKGEPVPVWGRFSIVWPALPPLVAMLMPFLVGALGFLNSWDFPTYALVGIAAYALGRAWARRSLSWAWASESLCFGGLVLVGGFVLYLPFYIGFRSQASGLGAVVYAKTPWLQYVLIFGLFLAVLVPWLLRSSLRTATAPRFGRTFAIALVAVAILPLALTLVAGGLGSALLMGIGSLLQGPFVALALALLIALAATLLWGRLRQPDGDAASTFALLLLLAGLLLTFGTEFIYIRDSFNTRMNTMFKFYYQAWVLLGTAAAWGAGEIASQLRGRQAWGPRLWLGGVALLLVATLYYPVAAATSKAGLFAGPPTLDGTAWADPHSGDGAAIAWLGQHAPEGSVIVEAPGDEYNASDNRASGWTGLPTVLGWAGHEGQWGRSYSQIQQRANDVAAIYQSANANQVQQLLDKYGVRYVYVGSVEQQKYSLSPTNLPVLDKLMLRVYDQGGVAIFERRD